MQGAAGRKPPRRIRLADVVVSYGRFCLDLDDYKGCMSVVDGRSERAASSRCQCRSDRGARWSCVERVWSDVCEMRLSLVLLWLGAAAACGPSRGYTRRQGARRITPLVFGQHDPNISENKNTASGPPEGRITRDDERFKDLVPNYNPDIDFRDDEGTGADRLMTQESSSIFDPLDSLEFVMENNGYDEVSAVLKTAS